MEKTMTGKTLFVSGGTRGIGSFDYEHLDTSPEIDKTQVQTHI